jgi:hypothetical protein
LVRIPSREKLALPKVNASWTFVLGKGGFCHPEPPFFGGEGSPRAWAKDILRAGKERQPLEPVKKWSKTAL